MNSPEHDLLTRARGGDARPLLETWEPRIYRFGLRVCGDEETAREVLQETLLVAFCGLGGFREAELATWLYALARSFCVRQRRHREDREDREGASLGSAEVRARADESEFPDAATHARELGRVLEAGLLSPRDSPEVGAQR